MKRESIYPSGDNQEAETRPEAPSWIIDNIAELSKVTRTLHVLYVTFLIYCGITILGSSDRKIVLDETARLPVIGSELPYASFMLVAPLAAIFLFVYFQLHLNALIRTISDLRTKYSPLDTGRLYPWMIILVQEHDAGIIQTMERTIISVSLWWLLPTILLLFFLLALKKPQGWRQFELLLLLAGGALVFWFWHNYESVTFPIQKEEGGIDVLRQFVRRHGEKALLAACILLFPAYIGSIIPLNWFTIDLHNQVLITEGKDDYGTYLVDLQESNLERANLFNTVLKRANLYRGIFDKANLSHSNLSHANLSSASFLKASLYDANLQGANLISASFNGANLQLADMQDANLQDASFMGANLLGVKNLKAAQFSQSKPSALFTAFIDDSLRVDVEKNNPNLLRCPFVDPVPLSDEQRDERKKECDALARTFKD